MAVQVSAHIIRHLGMSSPSLLSVGMPHVYVGCVQSPAAPGARDGAHNARGAAGADDGVWADAKAAAAEAAPAPARGRHWGNPRGGLLRLLWWTINRPCCTSCRNILHPTFVQASHVCLLPIGPSEIPLLPSSVAAFWCMVVHYYCLHSTPRTACEAMLVVKVWDPETLPWTGLKTWVALTGR